MQRDTPVLQHHRDAWERYGPMIFHQDLSGPEALAAFERDLAPGQPMQPVAYRYVHLDYAGRKVSRYGTHPERVNGHDPIEVHPLYEHPRQPQHPASEDARERATEAVAKAWYGPNFDPFSAPEYWAMAETVADAVLAALRQPAAQVSEDAACGDVAGLRDILIDAYMEGAMDVHNAWIAGEGQHEADFGEAACDHADWQIEALSQPQPAEPDVALVLQKYEAGPSVLSNAVCTYNLARNAGRSQHESMDAAIRQVLGAVGSDAALVEREGIADWIDEMATTYMARGVNRPNADLILIAKRIRRLDHLQGSYDHGR